jgi:general secretion pathway protein G
MVRLRRASRSHGFTFVELSIVVAIASLLVAIGVPMYTKSLRDLKVKQASGDLMRIFMAVSQRRTIEGSLPDSLAGIPNIPALDPWGRPYVYNYFDSPTFDRRLVRKDHNLHPINSEFDLYSSGEDGNSRAPLTASASRDDVILARDGSFVGLAKDF